jgi:hypothetical protein
MINSPSKSLETFSPPSEKQSARWYQPIFSPEHGVYVILLISFFIGGAAAQYWNLNTSLALIAAFAAFQAEHPLVLQIKQRRSWKPRLLCWGGVYGAIALGIAVYLYLSTPVLIWLYVGAIAAFVVDAISVFYRQQRAIANEILTFAAVCLATPLAYAATTGAITVEVLVLWLFNTLFFSSAIFRVKLRKPKTGSLKPGLIYHLLATVIIIGLWGTSWLNTITAIAFGVALITFGIIGWQIKWYKSTEIKHIALIETLIALVFFAITAVSLLPVHPL